MKFSIRDLMWLTVLVAVLTAWWAEHRRLAQENNQLKERLGQETYQRQIWASRAEELQNRADMLIERYTAPPVPNSQAPAPKSPKP